MPSRFAFLAIILSLASCGPRDGAFNPSNFRATNVIAPRDVAVPSNAASGDTDYGGLYVGDPSLLSCCWLAPHARLLVRKHAIARKLVVGFWVPRIPFFRAHRQTVKLRFDRTHARPVTLRMPNTELNAFRVAVPASLRNQTGLIPISLDSAVTFVPALDSPPPHAGLHQLFVDLHLAPPAGSQDVRHLGIILMYAYFE